MADPLGHTRARRAALVSGLALLLGGTALATAPAALAQVQQAVALTSISVQGNERIDSETVLSYLPLSVGDSVDPQKLDVALKALFRTDLFSDVKLDLNGSVLVIRVVENPVINQVLFEGNSNLKTDKLQDEVQIIREACSPGPRSRRTSDGSSSCIAVPGESRQQ